MSTVKCPCCGKMLKIEAANAKPAVKKPATKKTAKKSAKKKGK